MRMRFRGWWLILALVAGVAQAGQSDGATQSTQPDSSATSSLTPEMIYDYLVMQVAAQRGQWPVACQMALRLAEQNADPQLAETAFQVSVYAGNRAAAQRAAELWLHDDPHSSQALHATIGVLLAGKHPAEALPYIHQLLAEKPDMAGQLFLQLDPMFATQPDKTAAWTLMQGLAQEYPRLPEAQLVLAQLAARAGHFDAALAALKTVSRLKPGWDLAAKLQFEVLQQTNPTVAGAFMADYLKQYPNANDVRLMYARYLVNKGQIAAARDQFSALAQALPDNAQIQIALGMVSLQTNDFTTAGTAFRQALQHNYPDPGLPEVYLGQIAEAQHHDKEAADWYQDVGPGPQYLLARVRYAALLARQGKLEKARAVLQDTQTDSDDDRVKLIRAEAQLLHEAGQDKAAYGVLDAALSTRPDSIDLLYDHALMAENIGRIDVAERDLRHLLALQPNHAQALNALGYTFADHDVHLNQAVDLLQKALALDPDDPFILDSMGWAQYRLGHFGQAESYLQRAYDASKDPEIAAHLGEVLWKQGKFSQTHDLWQRAQSVSPDNAVLKAAVQKFK